jgi:hypothetical protein
MAEKNSLWKNIRNKAKQNRRTGAKPKKPTAEMLRQERKIKAQKADGGPVGDDGLYNMQRALELGYTPDETGHWPSVDSETGMWLKSKEHPTAWMEYMHGYALNPEVQKQYQHPVVNPEGYFGENQLQYNLKPNGGPTKSLVQPPVLLDDNIIYPTDNPYMPGVNKDILDSEYDSYMRWRENLIRTEGITPEEFFQTYPSRQEWERKNFDPANLHNDVSLAQGGRLYAEGGGEDEPKLLNRDGLLIAPTLPEFEVIENLTDEEKFRIEKYNERLNQQKAYQEKMFPGQEYDPTNIEKRANMYADDATAQYILSQKSPRTDFKNRQTYLESFTPYQRKVIEKSNLRSNLEPDIGSQFRMGFNKLIGRDYLGAQRMNYDSDISAEDYESASRLGMLSPLLYPLNVARGVMGGQGRESLSGEISRPWKLSTEQPMGMEDVSSINLLGDVALDPLNFIEQGAAGFKNLRKTSQPLISKIVDSDTFQALTFKDKFDLAKRLESLSDNYFKNQDDLSSFRTDELYPYEDYLQGKEYKISNYFENKFGNLDKYRLASLEKNQSKTLQELEPFRKQGDSIVKNVNSRTAGFTKSGEQTITNFRTGEKVLARVEEPGTKTTYTINNKNISSNVDVRELPQMNDSYVQTLRDNKNFAEESIPGLKIFGSSQGVTEGGLHHLTDDLDGLITQSNYEKNVKDNYSHITDNGPAKQHDFGKTGDKSGYIDFNIIHEDANGNVVANWYLDRNGNPRSLEVELFRQFDPEGFYKASKEAIKNQSDIKIPYKAQELLDKVDSTTKTIIDAYEAQKPKHLNKIDAYINFGNIDKVLEAQDKYIKSAVGVKGNLGHQFDPKYFSNPNDNLRLLNEIEFIGDVEVVAKDPKRMQAALNDYYINNSVVSRNVNSHNDFVQNNLSKLEESLSQWYPEAGGGNFRGEGLNNVMFGDPQHVGNIISHRQLGLSHNTKSPLDYVKSVKRQTDGNYVFNQDELGVLENLMKKHFGDEVSQNISDVQYSKDLLNKSLYQPKSKSSGIKLSKNDGNRPVKFFDDVTKELGIRSVSQKGSLNVEDYGNSWYNSTLGKLDKLIDTMEYTFTQSGLSPKSFKQRQQASYASNKAFAQGTLNTIDNIESFKRISNLLSGGLEKINSRISSLNQQLDANASYMKNLQNKFMKKDYEKYKEFLQRESLLSNELTNTMNKSDNLKARINRLEDLRKDLQPALGFGALTAGVGSLSFDQMYSSDPLIKPHHFNAPTRLIENLLDPLFLDPSDRDNSSSTSQNSHGGYINPYMYYAGGPMYYGDGGKIWKHIGAGAYGILEGGLDTLTFGATDKLTDKGFDWLTKVGNKNLDLNDPKNAKFLRTQQQIRGYSNVAGAIGTAAFTGQWGSAIGQSAKGVNTAFQATEGLSDDFKKWSNISSQAIGIGAGLAGGSLNSAQSASKIGQAATKFGSQASKVAPYANQAMGMLGNSGQPLWQQAEARQEYLNSPEYLAMREQQNQAYVNQGLSFAANGGPVNNNLLTLQTDSMRNRYKTYKTKYRQGGSMNQSNVDFISDEAGLHQENVYDGVPLTRGKGAYANGGAALVEANEGVIRDEQGNPSFILPAQGNGEPVYMLQPNASYTDFERDKDGNYIQLPITVADWRKKEENRGSNFRDPKNDYASNPRKDKDNQLAMRATEIQKQLKSEQAQQNQMMVEGALQYAAAGGKLNKDLERILIASDDIQSYVEADNYYAYGGYLPKDKGFNMPNSYAKGGSIHIKESKKGTFTAAAKKRGKSVQEFAKDVLRNKGKYSAAMVKKANFARNAASWKHAVGGPLYGNTDSEYTYAHGGPVVSNVNQDFGLYAQNRGGMMMAEGGMMQSSSDRLTPQEMAIMAKILSKSPDDYHMNQYNKLSDIEKAGVKAAYKSYTGSNFDDLSFENQFSEPYKNAKDSAAYLRGYNTGYETGAEFPKYSESTLKQGMTNDPLYRGNSDGYFNNPKVKKSQGGNMYFGGGDFDPNLTQYFQPNEFEDLVGTMTQSENPWGNQLLPSEPEQIPGPYNPSGQYGFYGKDSEGNDFSINPNMVNEYEQGWRPKGPSNIKTAKSNQPNQGLTGLDYASMTMQALPYFYQTAVGLKGADPVNYERVTGEKIDPTVAIALSAEEARRAQDSAAYLMRQSAPTSGSYMNNLRNLSLQSGKQRGALAGGLRYQADLTNTQMQNELNKVNAGISMQEQIDRLQEKDAARTNITEGLSGLGSTTANVIRDYRTNQINQMIAKNIGTNNYKYDPINQTITYQDQSGKTVTVPAQTVIPPNVATNVGTGQIQQPGTSQFETGFDNRLNESFRNRFRGPNAGNN